MRDLYEWIKNYVHEWGMYSDGSEIAEQAERNPALKKTILELLNKADFNISDFQTLDTPLSEKLHQLLKDQKFPDLIVQQLTQKQILFTHHAGEETFFINFENQSAGTKAYFHLARLLFDLKNGMCVSMEDELEESLHYDLLLHFLETFLHTSVPSQLIFTTHNQQLLGEEWLIRRDMIWFTEKDRKTCSTTLYRASDMGIHKNVSLMNAYRIGKLGAKPLLGTTYLTGDEE